MYAGLKRFNAKINGVVCFLDKIPLLWLGFVVVIITFVPWFILKEGSVFTIHDQLDETILAYIFNARYLGSGVDVFPEMMGGLNKTGIQPSAILFVPLYRILKPFIAFLIQYITVVFAGYIGMYLLIKRITESSILAVVVAICFCMLPVQPIYGLAVLGVPLLVYAFICLYDKKRIVMAYLTIFFFGVTTHLVLIGYVVLGAWACYIVYMFFSKKRNMHLLYGFLFLLGIYVVTNYSLFVEVFIGNNQFISHREEFVNYSMPFWESARDMFLNSSQHAESFHKELILPICIMLVIDGFIIRKKSLQEKRIYYAAVLIFVLLVVIALFCGLCKAEAVVTWKNSVQGFIRYFQIDRVYFLYPFLWYFEFTLVVCMWWQRFKKMMALNVVIVGLILLPTLLLIKENSNLYMNVNQINNGSYITGYISWESYYAEDLMKQLDEVIGRDKADYRIVHLGMSPTPSLMYGFYTIDGYSNNYSMEYKHEFREIISKELDKNEYIKVYFDTWGSRCYLFNHIIGDYYWLSKNENVQFENLEFDMGKMKELGCEYLFSAGEILDADEMGLELLGYYETEKSHWGVWLYQLKDNFM